MMRTKLTLVAASLATLMMTTAHAVPPPAEADLSISAKVVPSACNLDFANNGTFDYGDMPASTLSASGNTLLPTKSLNYAITCNAPTTVSFAFVDNRAGTNAADMMDPSYSFGLGQANGVNIGSNHYHMINSVGSVMVDGAQGGLLWSNNGGVNWNGLTVGWPVSAHPSMTYSFANIWVDSNAPSPAAAITTVSGVMEAKVNIAPSSSFDMTQAINIDGFATVQLTYI